MPNNRYRLPVGRTLATWLQAPEQTLAQRLRLRWESWWFEHNLAASKALAPAKALPAAPLLIAGLWRSGTTLLHEWLSALPGYVAPQTWQCMAASTFVVTGAPAATREIARPMDAARVSAHTPQEDEFALLAMGTPSAYRGFMAPNRLLQVAETLSPAYWLAHPAWLKDWQWFLSAVAPEAPARLVLKTPNHTFRAPAIAAAMPTLDWVWLMRDPEEAWHSNWAMWQHMAEAYSGRRPAEADLHQFLARVFQEYLAVLQWAANEPQVNIVFLPYATLQQGPAATVAQLREKGLALPDWPGGTAATFSATERPTQPQRLENLASVFSQIRQLHAQLAIRDGSRSSAG